MAEPHMLGEQKVDLCETKLNLARAKALAKEIAADKHTTELLMGENECGMEGLMAVTAALEKNTAIASFSLIISEANAEVGKSLAHALLKNTTMKRLALDVNKLGPDGAAAFGKTLEKNHSLIVLSLNQNEIGSKGAAALAAGLVKNASLQQLYLNENKIGSEGATALARSLTKHTALTTLSLEENAIGPDGAAALASYITATPLPALRHLSLKDNSIGEDGGLVLMKAVEVNTRIQSLAIQSNGVSEKVRDRITQILKRELPPPPVPMVKIPSSPELSRDVPANAVPPIRPISSATDPSAVTSSIGSEASGTAHRRTPSSGSYTHSKSASPLRSHGGSARKDSSDSDREKEAKKEKKPSSARGISITAAPSGAAPPSPLSRSGSGARLRSKSDLVASTDTPSSDKDSKKAPHSPKKEKKEMGSRTSSSRSSSPAPPPIANAPVVAPLAVQMPSGVVKEGWLTKVTKSGGKCYWFTVTSTGPDGPEVYWSETERGLQRKGSLLLRSALVSVPKSASDAAFQLPPNTLAVKPAHGPRLSLLYLSAESRPELIQWLDQILAAAHKESP